MFSINEKVHHENDGLSALSDLGRIQTCNLLSRNQMRYSVAPRGRFKGCKYKTFLFISSNIKTKKPPSFDGGAVDFMKGSLALLAAFLPDDTHQPTGQPHRVAIYRKNMGWNGTTLFFLHSGSLGRRRDGRRLLRGDLLHHLGRLLPLAGR